MQQVYSCIVLLKINEKKVTLNGEAGIRIKSRLYF